jgi:hypothetical protein
VINAWFLTSIEANTNVVDLNHNGLGYKILVPVLHTPHNIGQVHT